MTGLRGFLLGLLWGRLVLRRPLQLEGPDPIFFFPFLIILCEVAWPIAGETPPGVHLLDSHSMGHLNLQNRVIWHSLLEVTRDVQPLIFLVRRLNLRGVSILMRRGLLRGTSLIIQSTSCGNKCCCLVESRLVA